MPAAVDLHRLHWGSPGPAVVLIHGLTGRAALWSDVATRLADEGYHVIAPDLRGHGTSPRPGNYSLEAHTADVVHLLESTGPACLVGHSLGGAVAWHVAAARPDVVRCLVIEDQHPNATTGGWQYWMDWATSWPLSLPTREAGIGHLQAEGRSVDWWSASLEPAKDGTWGWAFDVTAVVESARSLWETDSWDTLAGLYAPTMIIRGGLSPHLEGHVAQRMVHTIPHCKLVTIPEADHWVHRDPDPYVKTLLGFLKP